MDHLETYCLQTAQDAQAAAAKLRTASQTQRDSALREIAKLIRANAQQIIDENKKDIANAPSYGLTDAMIDRLTLTEKSVNAIADAVDQIADQPDPLGRVIEGSTLANGIELRKMAVPIGCILIIFESRPNVTADAAALCLKAGNATILRGGKEALHSNTALANIIQKALQSVDLDPNTIQLINTTDRKAVSHLLGLDELIDVCIPRGGESLIRAVVEQSKIPVIKHYTGNCHLYLDKDADAQMAIDIAVNAKTQRTGVCNATETIVIHESLIADGTALKVLEALKDKGVELRADEPLQAIYPEAKQVSEEDYKTEFLDLIVALKTVGDVSQAIDHINQYSSKHTEAIVTSNIQTANTFTQRIDSANVFINCSTRFSDGGQYGLGAEIGISTDKLHARGPMGAQDLTTYKWIATGSGQIRE